VPPCNWVGLSRYASGLYVWLALNKMAHAEP